MLFMTLCDSVCYMHQRPFFALFCWLGLDFAHVCAFVCVCLPACPSVCLSSVLSGAVALAEYVAMSKLVQHVNVQRNDIRVGGLMALARALNLSETLIRLDFDRNIRVEQVSGIVI